MQPMLLKKANGLLLVKASGYQTHQRRIQGICSAVMTGPFVLQVLKTMNVFEHSKLILH